jgi:hypothetical protein
MSPPGPPWRAFLFRLPRTYRLGNSRSAGVTYQKSRPRRCALGYSGEDAPVEQRSGSAMAAAVVPAIMTMPMVVAPPRSRSYPGGAVICSGGFRATIKPAAGASARGVLGECRSRDNHAERECHTGQGTNDPCAHEDLT